MNTHLDKYKQNIPKSYIKEINKAINSSSFNSIKNSLSNLMLLNPNISENFKSLPSINTLSSTVDSVGAGQVKGAGGKLSKSNGSGKFQQFVKKPTINFPSYISLDDLKTTIEKIELSARNVTKTNNNTNINSDNNHNKFNTLDASTSTATMTNLNIRKKFNEVVFKTKDIIEELNDYEDNTPRIAKKLRLLNTNNSSINSHLFSPDNIKNKIGIGYYVRINPNGKEKIVHTIGNNTNANNSNSVINNTSSSEELTKGKGLALIYSNLFKQKDRVNCLQKIKEINEKKDKGIYKISKSKVVFTYKKPGSNTNNQSSANVAYNTVNESDYSKDKERNDFIMTEPNLIKNENKDVVTKKKDRSRNVAGIEKQTSSNNENKTQKEIANNKISFNNIMKSSMKIQKSTLKVQKRVLFTKDNHVMPKISKLSSKSFGKNKMSNSNLNKLNNNYMLAGTKNSNSSLNNIKLNLNINSKLFKENFAKISTKEKQSFKEIIDYNISPNIIRLKSKYE